MDDTRDTKERIFDAFIELTSELGYENVSVRDIGREVGINSASIYHHFKQKIDILEYAYEYYREHQYDARRPLDEMKALVETEDAVELVRKLTYTFDMEDLRKTARLTLITKIIYMRLFQDPSAYAAFIESTSNNTEYAVAVLQHGVTIGRIDPDFDIETFVDVLIGSLQIMGIKAFANPSYRVGQLEQESKIVAVLTQLLAGAMS